MPRVLGPIQNSSWIRSRRKGVVPVSSKRPRTMGTANSPVTGERSPRVLELVEVLPEPPEASATPPAGSPAAEKLVEVLP